MIRLASIIGAVVLALIIQVTPGEGLAQSLTISVAYTSDQNTSEDIAAAKFKELVETRLPEKVSVTLLPINHPTNSLLYGVLLGDYDIAFSPLAELRPYAKGVEGLTRPFRFSNQDELKTAEEGAEGKALFAALNKRSINPLGFLRTGMEVLVSDAPIHDPQDLKGLRFLLTYQGLSVAWIRKVSAIPIPPDGQDPALLTKIGVVDVFESNIDGLKLTKEDKVVWNVIQTNHVPNSSIMVTNAARWSQLSRIIREVMESSAKEALAFANEQAINRETDNLNRLTSSGIVNLITVDTSDRQKWSSIIVK